MEWFVIFVKDGEKPTIYNFPSSIKAGEFIDEEDDYLESKQVLVLDSEQLQHLKLLLP